MGQIIGIDTALFIYVLEYHPQLAEKSLAILEKVESGEYQGVFSLIGLVELLTGPKKLGRDSAAAYYKEKISTTPNLFLTNLNSNIVDVASSLRAKYGLGTPDAIHLATAIDAGADKFITNDKSLKKVKEIKIQLL